MKNKFWLLVLVVLQLSCKSNVNKKNQHNIIVSCDSLNNVAAKNYESDEVNKTITLFEDVALCYLSKEDSAKASYSFLNMATLYMERLKDYDEAIEYAKKSKHINNSAFHTANVDKLIGLLYGELNEIDSSEFYFDLAEEVFTGLNSHKAVAVVNYDRSIVSFKNKDFQNSKKWLEVALAALDDDTQFNRIFTMNNFGILLGMEMKDSSLVSKSINKNNYLLRKNEVIKRNIDSFYVLHRKYDSLK